MSYPANQQQSQRWLPVFNTTDETIPAYAVMQIAGYGNSEAFYGFGSSLSDEGVAYWRVEKPNATMQRDQSSICLFFNGPNEIPPKSFGQATQDFPCLVKHDGSLDSIWPGTAVGPVDGLWSLQNQGGGAFTTLGHVEGGPSFKGNNNHLMWVANTPRAPTQNWLKTDIRTDENATPSLAYFQVGGNTSDNGNRTTGQGVGLQVGLGAFSGASGVVFTDDCIGVSTRYGGTYAVSLSGTLWSETAPRGAMLTLQIESWLLNVNSNSEPATPYRYLRGPVFVVSRAQQVEQDKYFGIENVIGKENVSGSHPMYLPDGAAVAVRNMSSYPVNLIHAYLSVHRLGSGLLATPARDPH